MHSGRPTVSALALMAALLAAGPARGDYGQPSFYVDHPTRNSQDFTAAVFAAGGLLNTDMDFRDAPAGILPSRFYDGPKHPDGVTLTASDASIDTIVAGAGPGQLGKYGTISEGEGASGLSSYLLSTSPGPGGHASLTISFAAPVMAVGLFTIDYFGSDTRTNALTLSLYSGPDGRGTLLGTATAAREDFQPNALYFMGYVASSATIGSAVFSRGPDGDGDAIGIGPILFATPAPDGVPVPEPTALALLALGGALGLARRARR